MIKRVAIGFLALVGPVGLAAGCGSGSSGVSTTATTTTVARASTSTTAAGSGTTAAGSGTTAATRATPSSGPATTRVLTPGPVRVTDKDNGTTIPVGKGATIVVVLGSTYWAFPTAPDAAVLEPVGGVTTVQAPIGTCVPGGGCGTKSVTYKAVGTGHAQISASRTICGEAMGCTGTAGSYSVQVVVSAG